jgi:hypothetical protein
MTNGLVYTTIRRSNRNLVMLCVAGAVLIAGLVMLNQRYFYNNADSFRSIDLVALAFAIPLFLLCIGGLVLASKRHTDPRTHPIMRALSRFGPVDVVAGQIEAELQADHLDIGRLHLTQHWLVQATPTRLEAARLDDIVWAYKHVARQRGGMTYSAHIWDRHGVCISIGGQAAFVHQVLEASVRRAPWMLNGYNVALDKTWQRNRAAVVEAVDQRRTRMVSQVQGVLP